MEAVIEPAEPRTWTQDVGIIGGGAAALSAAVALARSRRSVVVVDAAEPRNAPADGVHNVLGRDGVPPLEVLSAGRKEAEHYGVDSATFVRVPRVYECRHERVPCEGEYFRREARDDAEA